MKSIAEPGETGITRRLVVNPGPTATGGEIQVAPPDARTQAAVVRTLALDLGTQTGWALMAGQEIIESGTELLASEEELRQQRREGKERTAEIRFARFHDFVALEMAAGVTRIVFEDVIFAGSQAQTQLWASLRAVIWVAARRSNLDVFCVPVATLKVFATGDGSAKKLEMAQALALAQPAQYAADPETGMLRRNGRLLDDNEVDAIWLALYTAAVDRGEEDFLGVYQRKAARKAERRTRRAVAKAQRKARNEVREDEQKTKRQALMASIKAMGKCCGVFRKPAPYGRAVCLKCGQAIRIPKQAGAPSAPGASPALERAHLI